MDDRSVEPDSPYKSLSAETTFDRDLIQADDLAAALWPLCERVAARMREQELAGGTVVLKLKTADFQLVTRRHRLPDRTQLAEVLYRNALPLLVREADGRRFRLIGIGAAELAAPGDADPRDLLDPAHGRQVEIERAIEAVRRKLGPDAIGKGRGWRRSD